MLEVLVVFLGIMVCMYWYLLTVNPVWFCIVIAQCSNFDNYRYKNILVRNREINMIAIVKNIYKIFQLFKEFIVISTLRNDYYFSQLWLHAILMFHNHIIIIACKLYIAGHLRFEVTCTVNSFVNSLFYASTLFRHSTVLCQIARI